MITENFNPTLSASDVTADSAYFAQTDLRRHIGLFGAVLLVTGNVIGSGIFLTSGVMLQRMLPTRFSSWLGSSAACWPLPER